MEKEPSVLDFLKAYLRSWRQRLFNPNAIQEELHWLETPAAAPSVESGAEAPQDSAVTPAPAPRLSSAIPWRALLALGFGLAAQISFEPRPDRTWYLGAVLYVVAAALLIWSNLANEWTFLPWQAETQPNPETVPGLRSTAWFVASLVLGLLAFLLFTGNLFTKTNVTFWVLSLAAMMIALSQGSFRAWFGRAWQWLTQPRWDFHIDRWFILVIACFGLVFFFRTYLLNELPSNMISDQAEKLWDVRDVLAGQTSLYFPRNTGREFFQFYLTAGVIKLFDTGLSYLSLKIGTVFAGLVAVVYIYFIGREVANRRVGLFAMLFAGIAYWPNIISRYGLRFPFYPMFYAPALYYLIRGLKQRNRNDFILSGLFVGLGLNGYSPYRIVPIALVIAIGLYLLHRQSEGYRKQAVWSLFALAAVSAIIFLPLLRYMLENPEMVMLRAMTRLGDWERPLPGPVLPILLQNIWNGLTMFTWSNGSVWAISIPYRPALDVVSGALFHLGVVLITLRYMRQRHWFDLYTLISIPVLMLPSTLSLAFPDENPSLNRPSAVMIPVFLIIALALDGLLTAIADNARSHGRQWLAGALALALFGAAALQNYTLVFTQYRTQYNASAWNTDEIGAVVRSFADKLGGVDSVWLVGYPYWVDSRLVMINAGYPDLDNAIWPDHFQDTLSIDKPKLFIIYSEDQASVEALRALYPNGWLQRYTSKYPNKDFLMFFTLPAGQ